MPDPRARPPLPPGPLAAWRAATARLGVHTAYGRDAVAAALAFLVLGVAPPVAAVVVAAHQPVPVPVGRWAATTLVTVAACLVLAGRRRWPRTALAAGTALVLAATGLSVSPTAAGVALLTCAYTVATVLPRRSWAGPVAGCLIAHAAGGILLGRLLPDATRAITYWSVPASQVGNSVLASAASFGIPLLVGSSTGTRRAYTAALADRAQRLEAERADRDQRAASEERQRIARELHDVAAHDLSAIVVQAGAVDRLIDRDPAAAKRTLLDIRSQGRQTLTSLRQLVGVLREDDAGGRAPQPGLARLDELVAGARAAGMAVDLAREGSRPLPAALDLTAYRVVQEALTNARRHAPGAPVRVAVTVGREVRVVVANDAPEQPPTAADPGHGLAGMRERVAQAGGSCAAGPTAGGGWQVEVHLPVGP